MTEVWKDIKGFEGLYQVSNMGRVKSLERLVERFMPHWGTTSNYVQPERIRKIAATRGGYLFLPLCKDGVNYPKRVNRLVAEAFVEDYSEDKEVHHIDGDITNNRADNLKCLSSKEHHQKHPGVSVIGTNGENTIIARMSEDMALTWRTFQDAARQQNSKMVTQERANMQHTKVINGDITNRR